MRRDVFRRVRARVRLFEHTMVGVFNPHRGYVGTAHGRTVVLGCVACGRVFYETDGFDGAAAIAAYRARSTNGAVPGTPERITTMTVKRLIVRDRVAFETPTERWRRVVRGWTRLAWAWLRWSVRGVWPCRCRCGVNRHRPGTRPSHPEQEAIAEIARQIAIIEDRAIISAEHFGPSPLEEAMSVFDRLAAAERAAARLAWPPPRKVQGDA